MSRSLSLASCISILFFFPFSLLSCSFFFLASAFSLSSSNLSSLKVLLSIKMPSPPADCSAHYCVILGKPSSTRLCIVCGGAFYDSCIAGNKLGPLKAAELFLEESSLGVLLRLSELPAIQLFSKPRNTRPRTWRSFNEISQKDFAPSSTSLL